MERAEISRHEVAVYNCFRDRPAQWMTNDEAHEITVGVAKRTIRLHTKRLLDLGILDRMELFPAHKFKLSDKASKRNAAYLARLQAAAVVFST